MSALFEVVVVVVVVMVMVIVVIVAQKGCWPLPSLSTLPQLLTVQYTGDWSQGKHLKRNSFETE